MTTIDANNYFEYLIVWKVLVCRGCKYGLQKNGVWRHLSEKHQAIPMATRKALVAYADTLTLCLPSEIQISSIIPRFECLELFNDGHRCMKCEALCGTLDSIQSHCRDKHKWVKSKGKGM
jgi:hypothetical protein